MQSPVGRLLIAGDDAGLRRIAFLDGERVFQPPAEWRRVPEVFEEARRQLRAYFDGRLSVFDLPLAPEGTAFQQEAWAVLRRIPYGQTIRYGEQARRMGRPNAARAVGAANGANPLPIVVPCHRVVSADGKPGGFTGGVAIKRALLETERGLAHSSDARTDSG